MELNCQLICECNGKMYKTRNTLKAHKLTQSHILWETSKEEKNLIIKNNRLENENGHLRRLNILLIERISELEKK